MLTCTEELLLLAHDEKSGQFANLQDLLMNTALAGAVLMDLALLNRIDTDVTALVVLDRKPTGEKVLDFALNSLGALPAKTKELMAVTAAHVTDCPWCIEEHVKRAIKQGATDEEIAEAAFVAMALRAGAAFAHSSIAMAVSDEQRAKAGAPAHSHEGHNH